MDSVFGTIIKKFSRLKDKVSNFDDYCVNKGLEKKGEMVIDEVGLGVLPMYENMEEFHDCCSEETEQSVEGLRIGSKYEFSSGIHISQFFEEPKNSSFIVHEGFFSSGDQNSCNSPILDSLEGKKLDDFIIEKVLIELERLIEAYDNVGDRKLEDSVHELMKQESSLESCSNEIVSKRQDQEIATEFNPVENVVEDEFDDEFIEMEPQSHKFEEISSRVICSQVQDKQQLEQSNSTFDDSDSGSDQEDIIEKIKMEIKNAKGDARKGGLPTISEESESPLKILPELKPLEIDEKFEHKDQMAEIQKMYKSYSDKMRKLDVLNMQTIHATGFTQQKISRQSSSGRKSSIPSLISVCKPRRPEAIEPMKCSAVLKNDFEMVYVGQLCLSWEILHWQYQKALELRECDPDGNFHYNQVAGEFQLFQVLLQRFLENEPFQGQPRIENYARSHSVLRSLLQVPVIIDDASRDKKQKNGDKEQSISIATLTYIIGESMRLLWEFVNADNMAMKSPHETPRNLQDPADLELMIDIRNNLHKKEKKLKEIGRSGSCIAKMFQKHEEYGITLFAQVELKLICRVLTMSKDFLCGVVNKNTTSLG
ncbi:hypothetical protein ACFE04_024372 [Oxalis oulophora]